MKDVAAFSDGRVKFSTGTLYGALKRLLDSGWIERIDTTDEEVSGRERKAYTLTDLGRRILAAETARLEELASLSRRRLRGSES